MTGISPVTSLDNVQTVARMAPSVRRALYLSEPSTSQSPLPLRALYLSEPSTSQSPLPLRALYLSALLINTSCVATHMTSLTFL